MLGPKLLRVVQEAVRQQSETGYPQAIILSGEMTQILLIMGASLKASRGQDGQMMLLMHKSEKNYLLLCSYIAHCIGFILYAINISTIDSTPIYRILF
jgi:high-affinity K+ transport system ATPase subunit B